MQNHQNRDYKWAENTTQLTANIKASQRTESTLFPASRHAVNSGSEDQRVAHILTSSDKAWLTLMCLEKRHPPRSFNVSFQDALCQFSCMCSALSLQNMHAGSNGWVGKECHRLRQVSPEVMNFIQSSESVVSSKYLLINWKKFSFYCVTESVVRPQRECASRPTFPETGDLFCLKQHCMWWKNYLRAYTHLIPNKPRILPVSSSIISVFSIDLLT